MDRMRKIWETACVFLEPLFLERCMQIQQGYEADMEALNSELFGVLSALFKDALALQKDGTLGVVKYVEVAVLHSSAVTETYESRLAVYDQRMFLGPECCTYWRPTFLYQYVQEDITTIQGKIHAAIPRVHDYELEELRRRYVWNYHIVFKSWLNALAKEIFCLPAFGNLQTASTVTLLFGEYMGDTTKLYTVMQ